MGMLDPSQFDPAQFSGGGLPDWLKGAQAEAGPAPQGWLQGGGAPAPQGQDGAALPAASQPAIGQLAPGPAQLPGRDPSLLDRVGAAFHGFAHSKGQGLLGAISNAVQGGTTGERVDPQGQEQQSRAETFKALTAQGVPPQEALAATLNPSVMESVSTKYLGTKPLLNIEGQLRHPTTGALVGNTPPKIETIKDPSSGMDISVVRDASGNLRRVDPRALPTAGQQPTQVRTFEEALRLPPGTPFTDPFGTPRVR